MQPVTAAQLGATWKPGCPVGPEQLRRVEVNYLGFDGQTHRGGDLRPHDVGGVHGGPRGRTGRTRPSSRPGCPEPWNPACRVVEVLVTAEVVPVFAQMWVPAGGIGAT